MNPDTFSNNKKIAKNTLFLYIRTFITLFISLYTSRVTLKALGVDDYGIYNIVGGFVAMFSLLSGSLSNAISRFLAFELGRNDKKRLKDVFSTSVTIQIILAAGIIILAEIIGVWFLNTRMNIPEGRLTAANWVFQCSLFTFGINLISIPYNACIIAHEHMKTFAYVSIIEAALKLGCVGLLFIIGFDRLVVYALLILLLAIGIRLLYGVYCNRKFEESHFYFSLNKELFKEMMGVASWNFLGSSGTVLKNHGVNILMNLFFGVRINAARGLANQVNAAVTQFVNSFTTAVNPQITKSYAQNEKEYTFNIVMLSAKYSFFLMLLLVVPIFIEAPFFLKIWLKNVPDYTVLFVRLTFLVSLLSTLSTPLYTLALATGDIKKYQIVVGSMSLSCFAITYVCYKMRMPVEAAYYVSIGVQILILFARLQILSKQTGLRINDYLRTVISKVAIVTLIISTISLLSYIFFPNVSFLNTILVLFISMLCTITSVLYIGMTFTERKRIFSLLNRKR